MNLREQMAADLAAIHGEADGPAETVTYTPDGGAAAQVSAVLCRLGKETVNLPDGTRDVETARLVVTVATVAAVTLKDRVTVAGITGGTEEWAVHEILWENAAARELRLIRDTRRRLIGAGQEHDIGGNARR